MLVKSKIILCILLCSIQFKIFAQTVQVTEDTSWKSNYRAFPTKENDLVHTKLAASFDYQKAQLNGEVWLKLHPHFYPTNQLTLDAKGMDIHQVCLVLNNKTTNLHYQYDSLQLTIDLDKVYTSSELYTIYIKYTAKPNEYKSKGSAAITEAKGLYFINPLGEEKNKPTQIWTQGETEGTSVWIPIIDKPNQKSTQEFHLTVPSKYVSLSNGKLVSQIMNKNGTRLDVWKMDLPHAPYLFFIGIGDYAIIKEEVAHVNVELGTAKAGQKKLELSYYIEKEYEKVAKNIYGKTPEMITFYEKILGINYPWSKYAQISGRNYVSGAMENTTCTLHSDAIQQNSRELVDGNSWEGTIAHELFHQWFGDYVTAESWSNLTVNESFADYSQTLWLEHSKGKDAGDYENYIGLQNYLGSPYDSEKDLVRFFYNDREDMFDLVSYQKGGRILHMLRNLVGDDAFFKSLHQYLNDNKFSTGSAIKLKLAFEAVTGKDLNWFFNQWYFGSGHPYVRILQQYQADQKRVLVTIQQTQIQNKVFTLPIGVDVYINGIRNHYEVWSKNRMDSFYFPATSVPDNINIDSDKVLLWAKDETKPLTHYIYQYYHGRNFMDRYEASKEAIANIKKPDAYSLVQAALKDSFYIIRLAAINSLNPLAANDTMEKAIVQIALKDPNNLVRAEAIDFIGALQKEIYKPLYIEWIKDSSYTIAGAALDALNKIDSTAALKIAIQESTKELKKRLNTVVIQILSSHGDENSFDFIADKYEATNKESEEKFSMTAALSKLLINTTDPLKFKRGINLIVAFKESIPSEYKNQTDPYFNIRIFGEILKAKKIKKEQSLVDIVSEVLPKL